MGFFDKIQGLLNPAIIEEYDDLYKNHFEAIDKYVRNFYEPRKKIELQEDKNAFLCYDTKRKEISDYLYKDWVNKDYENNTVKLSFKQKEYIVNHKNEILDLYNRFNKYEKATEECIRYYNEYPHAIAYYCVKVLDLYLTSVEMPMYSIDEKGNMDATMFCALMLKNTIKYVGELTFLQKRELLEHKVFFPEREKQLLKEIKDNKICIDFQINILGNEERKKYYKDFLAEHKIYNHNLTSSKKYCLKNCTKLDSYISEQNENERKRNIIFNDLLEQYDGYILPFIRHKYNKNNVDSLLDNEKEYLIKNYCEIIDYIELEGQKKIDELSKKFPLGMQLFEEEFWSDIGCLGIIPDSIGLIPNTPEWWSERFESRICHHDFRRFVFRTNINKEKIALLDLNGKAYKNGIEWENKQKDFAQTCRKEIKVSLKNWGAYKYDVPFKRISRTGEIIDGEFKIWQIFMTSYCIYSNIDYSLCPQMKNSYNLISKLEKCELKFKTDIYINLVNYIENIKKTVGKICVIVPEESENRKNLNEFYLSSLFDLLENKNIVYCRGIDNYSVIPECNMVFIVSLNLSNLSLRHLCKYFINRFKAKSPLITVVSLLKEHDKKEMLDIIKRKQDELRKEQDRIQKEKNDIVNCVSSWYDIGYPAMKCFSMYNYYPTTCDFEATNEEWNIRKMIWNFKANKGGTLSNAKAMTKIVPDVLRCLSYFFGEYLSKLTFVCIPASTRHVTKLRYEKFSQEICKFTGMENGFPHITIDVDGEAKHTGGKTKAQYRLDVDFFKNKYILLFDDVITKGNSMHEFKGKLEKLGAIVIGGFSIGVTKHERLPDNPIDKLDLPELNVTVPDYWAEILPSLPPIDELPF